jgi:hypothetical protein
MFARISPKTSRGRWLRLMLALKKFRLVIVGILLTVVNRLRSVIGNSLYMSVRWRGGGEVVVFRKQCSYNQHMYICLPRATSTGCK